MIAYPAWCTAVDRKRLDDALAAAKPPVVRHVVVMGGVQSCYASDADALRAVLDVYQVIVQIVEGQPMRPSIAAVRALLHQVIVELDPLRPQTTTSFDAFVQMVDDAIGLPMPMPPLIPSIDHRKLLSIPVFAAELGVSDDLVHDMIGRDELSFVIVGKRKKIPPSELDRLRTAHPAKYGIRRSR